METDYTIKELKELYGDALTTSITQQSIKELSEGKPVHIGELILVPIEV